ncbi:hypothetical protein HYZ97_03715 [Candidatus Pacearchaeota archaeon]|nr:hypothetical protein [Candidatus Pacearchaeota archaeon]
MARTPEQILREIVADQIFRIAQLVAENEKLKEDFKDLSTQLTAEVEKLRTNGKGNDK